MKSYEQCVKLLSYGPCVALIGSLLIGSPQGLAQNAESSPSEPLRLTVAPHTFSRIAMKTLSKAVCVLHPEGDSDVSHQFKLFSDDEGMIRFNVNPREETDQVAAFAVDCTADGQSHTFGLELRPSSTPSFDMPAPVAEIRTPKVGDFIRPALTQAEALQLSDDELVKREYPVRPNSKEAPDAFAAWLKIVTHPARRVGPRQVTAGVRAGSNWELTLPWSGFELRAANLLPTYDLVIGEWNVPTVSNAKVDTTALSYFWIGLDGDGPACQGFECETFGDLWQAGTAQQAHNYWGLFDVTSYNAWTEFLPGQGSAQYLADFNVSPGDLMYSQVWIGNAGEAPSLSGAYAIALVEDITQGEYRYVYNPLGSMAGMILGYEAEWIMERPGISGDPPGTYYDLANYGTAWMYGAYALQTNCPICGTNGSWVNYDGANNQDIWMYNGDLLSVPFVYNSTTIQYVWYNYY
jgi:hypothetical protein